MSEHFRLRNRSTCETQSTQMRLPLKLTIALSAGILAIHAAAAGSRVYREKALFEADIGRDERVLGRALAYAVERAWNVGGESEVQAVIDHANEREANTQVRWLELNPRPGKAAPLAPRAELSGLERGESVIVALSAPEEALLTYVPVHLPDVGWRAIEIVDVLQDEKAYIAQSIRSAALTALAVVVACASVCWLMTSRMVRGPLAQLAGQARAVAEGDLGRRVDVQGSDEVVALCVEMNRMCERLEAAWEHANVEALARADAIAQLRHADRLAAVGLIASSVAHELGTPINVIKGHSQLIGEGGVDPTAEQHLGVIHDQCLRMTGILRRLVDFSRPKHNATEHCVVSVVVKSTLEMIEPMARRARVHLQAQSGEGELAVAIAAPALQQVLLNLLVNALEAAPRGSGIQIRTRIESDRRRGSRADEQQVARIDLSDQGPGIPAELRQRIFEPFFTTKESHGGTGLGLFITNGIVTDHGGWLDVQTGAAGGTTFSVYLPLSLGGAVV